ncbi:MAG: hypothetical protein ACFFEO_14680 [Candidatus Thorarchaeota archaeon]
MKSNPSIKYRELNSSVLRSSVRPILRKTIEGFVIYPTFLIIIFTIPVFLFPIYIGWRMIPIWPPFPYNWEEIQRLQYIQNVYMPIVITCFCLIIVGVILNLSKKFMIKMGYIKQIHDVTKRKFTNEVLTDNFFHNLIYSIRYNFKLSYLLVVILLFFTGMLISVNIRGPIENIIHFVSNTYIPVVIICWIILMINILIKNLQKKLKEIKIKKD